MKAKAIINLTSEDLKNEYSEKVNFYKSGLKNIFFFCCFIIFDIFVELKNFGPSELNVAVLIMSFLSPFLCFLLIVNINGKVLLDIYSFVVFYLFAVIESIIFISLHVIKLINIYFTYKRLRRKGACKNKYKCPGKFMYYLILFMNLIIFLIFLLFIKFIVVLFLDGFNILIMKNKTFAQRQIEINEKNKVGKKIEFTYDKNESINDSLNQLNSNNILKTD